ncbi:MAG: hypothetical protein IKM61_09245 [Eubacteriaceae bacterium]|nr:hypothetical protein [Eubacteriaceae bacterium]
MDAKLRALLVNCDIGGIRDYFAEKEMEYYECDLQDIVVSLESDIPQYDCLVESLGIDNRTISADLFTDNKAMYSINAYTTDVPELYFIVTEEFGLDDGYGVVNELRFTSDIAGFITNHQ